ncbi:MAG: TrmH family RNA methyltransferase [Lautropia sp.]|nr:TrmH family RNA methyltransferase [Lautropia sp.]
MTGRSETHRPLAVGYQRLLDACRIVLMAPSLSANIGSAIRAMTTMGLRDLVVVAPRDPDFQTDSAALARAGGARHRLADVASAPTLDAALHDCQLAVAVSAEGRAFGPAPEYPGPLCADVLAALAGGQLQRVAFVFGTERSGLQSCEMARCQRWLTIPADAEYSSLNVAQAVQIVAFSLRQAVLAGVAEDMAAAARMQPPLARLGHIEALYRHVERSLVALGTLNPARPRRLMARLRHLFGRTQLTPDELDMLHGICRDIERRVPTAVSAARQGPAVAGREDAAESEQSP